MFAYILVVVSLVVVPLCPPSLPIPLFLYIYVNIYLVPWVVFC